MNMKEIRKKQLKDHIEVYTLDDSFEILSALQQLAQKNCKKKKRYCQKKKVRKDKPKVNDGNKKCNDITPACTDTFRLIPVDIIKSIEVVDSHSDADTEESSEW
jgi:hypothetical protein